MNPYISVIIPMFNAEEFIADALDSILSQTYKDWECIIMDDGSTDSSAIIVLSYCEKDSRFKYYRQKNAGPSAARNNGFIKSRGEFIQFLDADDVLSPKRFEILINLYHKTRGQVILYSNLEVCDSFDSKKRFNYCSKTTLGNDIDFKSLYKHFGNDILFTPGCILFPRKAIRNIKWEETMSYSEDWDYYLQISKYNHYNFRNVPIILFTYRKTKNSLSSDLVKVYYSCYRIIEKYRSKSNILTYCKKCGHFFYRNIINYIKGKISKIVCPIDLNNRNILSLIVFPVSLFFCILFFVQKK